MTLTLESLFSEATEHGASDLHLAVGEPPIIRLRGELMPLPHPEVTVKKMEELIFSILAPALKERFINDRELDTSYEIKDGTRFRVNLHFERGNMGLVARIIPTIIPTLEDIGMPEVVSQLTRLDYGLVIITGPTGCGKSTSLASMVNSINNERAANIITLEDPIEFIFKSKKSLIKQRQLGTDMLSFTDGLKHVLRQDPDVIMVGEMRDLDTISTTLTVAETGHLVFATLHTNSAAETVERIIDVFPPYQQNQVRLQLSYSLRAVISQRLLPSLNGSRVAAREILLNNAAVANLIRENKTAQIKSVIQTNAQEGMMTLDQHLKYLIKNDIISLEVALAHASIPETLD